MTVDKGVELLFGHNKPLPQLPHLKLQRSSITSLGKFFSRCHSLRASTATFVGRSPRMHSHIRRISQRQVVDGAG